MFSNNKSRLKISNICSITGGYPFDSADMKQKGIPVIKISNIEDNGSINLLKSEKTDKELSSEFTALNGDILIALSGATTGKIAKYSQKQKAYVNQRIGVIKPFKNISNNFLFQIFQSKNFKREFNKLLVAGAQPNVSISDILEIEVNLPNKSEYEKIGSFLSAIDEYIEKKNKKINSLYKNLSILQSKLLNYELRFKEFKGEINQRIISDVTEYEQPGNYIVDSEIYTNKGTPVLTANKAFILGYTEETNGIYNKGECFIFDDFTLDSKYVNFPFKVKSSAIKIITPKRDNNLKFIHQSIKNKKFRMMGHNRHWISLVSNEAIKMPSIKEQNKISNLLYNLERMIELEIHFIDKVKILKRYYLEKIFK